jgi:N-acetylgalactosamine-6-sulfatase
MMKLIRSSVAVLLTVSVLRATDQPPHIVFILADDLGYNDLGCYGAPDIRTPAIDRLAREGVRLTQFYANGPECSPTRTALMTGRYQQRVGGMECAIGTANIGRYDDAIRLRETHDLGLPADRNVLVSRLKRVGYKAYCIGKWHLGYETKFLPLEHGFDYAFGPIGGGVDYFHHTEWDGTHVLMLNDKPYHRKGYMTDLITDEAVQVIRRHKHGPMFLYVPYTAPHSPYQGPDDDRDKPILEDTWNEGTHETYVEMIERLDLGVSRILEALARAGLDRNTLVIFASDNGPATLGSARPLSGYKSSLMEGGIRVPAILHWPDRLERNVDSTQTCMIMDLTCSMVRIAGSEAPPGTPFDGIDIIQWLQEKHPPTKRTLFWRSRRGDRTWRAVRDGDLKYFSRRDGTQLQEHLYDLATDVSENNDLIESRSSDAQRLKRLLAEWEAEVTPAR